MAELQSSLCKKLNSRINRNATQLSHFTILQMFQCTTALKKVSGERWKFWQLLQGELRLLAVGSVWKGGEINTSEVFHRNNQ